MRFTQQPLYRKENTTAHLARHEGGDYRDDRQRSLRSELPLESMHGGKRRGLDYTPLFRFLLSKRGQPWDAIYAEAKSRLDREDPIFWLVSLPGQERQRYVRVGHSSYYSGLYVDDAGALQSVDPSLNASSFVPSCKCCTHTFNGVPFTRPFAGPGVPFEAAADQAT